MEITKRITMTPARRTQTGRVVDSEGDPVAGVSVFADLASANYAHAGLHAKSNQDGRFVLENMPDSQVYVRFHKDGMYASTRLDKDSGDVMITLKKN